MSSEAQSNAATIIQDPVESGKLSALETLEAVSVSGKGKAKEAQGDMEKEEEEEEDDEDSEAEEALMEAAERDPDNADAEDYGDIDAANILPPGVKRNRQAPLASEVPAEDAMDEDDEEDESFQVDN